MLSIDECDFFVGQWLDGICVERTEPMLAKAPANIYREHKAQIAEAEKQVAIASQLIHELCNHRTVRLILLETIHNTIRQQRLFRAAHIREKTTST